MKKIKIAQRYISSLFVAILLFQVAFFAIPQSVYAAQADPGDQLERWLYYRGMRACLQDAYFGQGGPLDGSDNEDISREDINAGQILGSGSEGFGYLAPDMDGDDGNDGTVDCSDGSIWVRGATLFGFSDVMELVCEMDTALNATGQRDRIQPSDDLNCKGSQEIFFDGGSDVFQQALTKALETGGDKDRPRLNLNDNGNNSAGYTHEALLYLIGKRSLETFCGASPLESNIQNRTTAQIEGNDDIVSVRALVNGEISENRAYAVSNPDRDEGDKVNDVYYRQGGNDNEADDISCADMAKLTRDYINAYKAWADKQPEPPQEDSNAPGNGNTQPTCESEGGALAWLFCGIIGMMDGTINFLDGAVNNLLFVDPERYDSPTIQTVWSNMRNIALLILVPMMMFMVIGTAINMGPFDPYTVKKALPRMFVAVIFIVLSLPVLQFAVAASNTIGQGIGNLIVSASGQPEVSIALITEQSFPGGAGAATGFAGVVAFGAFATGALTIGILASFAFVTLVALLIGFVILVMRQVLIVTLMVIAPLAILVWIFPGNDKLWGVWRTTFIAMLLMYPIIAVLLATGKFVAGLFGAGG